MLPHGPSSFLKGVSHEERRSHSCRLLAHVGVWTFAGARPRLFPWRRTSPPTCSSPPTIRVLTMPASRSKAPPFPTSWSSPRFRSSASSWSSSSTAPPASRSLPRLTHLKDVPTLLNCEAAFFVVRTGKDHFDDALVIRPGAHKDEVTAMLNRLLPAGRAMPPPNAEARPSTPSVRTSSCPVTASWISSPKPASVPASASPTTPSMSNSLPRPARSRRSSASISTLRRAGCCWPRSRRISLPSFRFPEIGGRPPPLHLPRASRRRHSLVHSHS